MFGQILRRHGGDRDARHLKNYAAVPPHTYILTWPRSQSARAGAEFRKSPFVYLHASTDHHLLIRLRTTDATRTASLWAPEPLQRPPVYLPPSP